MKIGRSRPKAPRRTLDAAGAVAPGSASRRARSAGEGSGFARAPGVRNARTSDGRLAAFGVLGLVREALEERLGRGRPREECEGVGLARDERRENGAVGAADRVSVGGGGACRGGRSVRRAVEGREEALLERPAGGGGHRAPPVTAPARGANGV